MMSAKVSLFLSLSFFLSLSVAAHMNSLTPVLWPFRETALLLLIGNQWFLQSFSFLIYSLNHLPNLPAFTFLRHSLLAGRGTYVHIVASILLHQKQLRSGYQLDRYGRPLDEGDFGKTSDDVTSALHRMRQHKQHDHEFPGDGTGSRRAGFCYGCEKNPKPQWAYFNILKLILEFFSQAYDFLSLRKNTQCLKNWFILWWYIKTEKHDVVRLYNNGIKILQNFRRLV